MLPVYQSSAAANHSCTSILRRGNAKSISVEEKTIMHKKSPQKALSCHKTSTPSKSWTVHSKELNMVEKQCILTEHKEGSGGLAAPADSLTLACHKGVSGIGGVSSVGLPATKWEETAQRELVCYVAIVGCSVGVMLCRCKVIPQ